MLFITEDQALVTILPTPDDPPEIELTIPDEVRVLRHKCLAELKDVVSITIPPGVEAIESGAAAELQKLREVRFLWDGDRGTREIGAGAFADAACLTDLILPDTMRRIHADAFAHCPRLRQVRLPDAPCAIAGTAFAGSTVAALTIPPRLESVAFLNTTRRVDALTVPAEHPRYTVIGNAVFTKDLIELAAMPMYGPTVTLPPTLCRIDSLVLTRLGLRRVESAPGSQIFQAAGNVLVNWETRTVENITAITPGARVTVPDGILHIHPRTRGLAEEAATISLPPDVELPEMSLFRGGDIIALRCPEVTVYWPFDLPSRLFYESTFGAMLRLAREQKRRDAERVFRQSLRLDQQMAMAVPLAMRFDSKEIREFIVFYADYMIERICQQRDPLWLQAFLPFGMTAENAVTLCETAARSGDTEMLSIVHDYRGAHFPFGGEMRL